MSDSKDVERRLRALASEPVPPADPTFVDDLDVHLRVMHVEELGAARPRPMWVPAVMGSMVVILLVVAGGLMLGRTSDANVILIAASDTDVILPGDEATPASAGLHLPDGTRIVVGDNGEAVVNGVVLGPGSEATVVGDRIDIVVTMLDEPAPIDGSGREPLVIEGDDLGDGDRSPATTTSGGNPASTSGPGDTNRPGTTDAETDRGATDRTDDRNNGSGGDRGVTTPATRGRPSSTRSSTTEAITSTVPPRSTTSTTRQTSSTTTGRPPAPLELTVTPVDQDRLRLDWTLNRDLVPAGWRVRVRRGDRVVTVVAIRDGDARMVTIERSVSVHGVVWIDALDRQGEVLLASDPVEIEES